VTSASFLPRRLTIAALALAALPAIAPAAAHAADGFGPLSGPGGCLVAPDAASSSRGTSACASGKALVGARAVAVSPDGANVYVVGGVAGQNVAKSFGGVAILKRDPATGAISETGCDSSDGTDGRDGASGACAAEPSLLGASAVAVSRDGTTVFVSSESSASVVAFSRDATTGSLTRIGCFQGTPRPGSPCGAANLFSSSRSLVVSADGAALYVAAPLEGAVSTLDTALSLRTPAGIVAASSAASGPGTSTTGSSTSSTGASTATGASPPRPLASIFSTSLAGSELLNPCIAVNGLDGVCAVGTATDELSALALSPDGKQVYATAPGSRAIDVFTPDATGALAQTGCVMVAAPHGLCTSGGRLEHPFALAVGPDGQNVYAASAATSTSRLAGQQLNVLARNATTGALSSTGCVEYQEPPRPTESEEEAEAEGARASAAASGCSPVAGLKSVSVVAVSGDSSSVYAIGDGSAAIFSRSASGQLTEASCADSGDSRCTSLPALEGVSGAAVSPDGRQVYVAAAASSAVMAFGVGAAVTTGHAAASRAGMARVSVACPAGLHRACRGRVDLTRATVYATRRHGHRSARVRRQKAGNSAVFSIAPGRHATVTVRLAPSARRVLRRHRSLRVMAVVHAGPLSGGSGYGRHVSLRLARF
jgi:DNA-binding beta-propeller fold protein YncE